MVAQAEGPQPRRTVKHYTTKKLFEQPVVLPCSLGNVVVKAVLKDGRLRVRVEAPDIDFVATPVLR